MTVSILRTLSTLSTGDFGIPLDFGELGVYLGNNLNTPDETARNFRHRLRDELYRDGGVNFMTDVINDIFANDKVKELRLKWIKHARFNNALKRVVNELSTVYASPAKRTVGDATNETYQRLLERVHMAEQSIEANRLYNLHRALLLGFRVRMLPDGSREPVLDIATPSIVRAILHPTDQKHVIGWLIRVTHKVARGAGQQTPTWALWTDNERALLDDSMRVIPGTWLEHHFGVCPWVPVVRHPEQAGFWPGEEGEDLVAAQVAIWFTNICMLKETKSGTGQTVVSGDTSAMARGQALESEVPLQAPDGTSFSRLEWGTELGPFRETSENVFDSVANNYGLASAIRKHQGVQSAEARDVLRIPLRELRMEQQTPFRDAERRLATVMAKVCAQELPEFAFDPSEWAIDFGDAQTPLSPREKLELFKMAREVGLDNTVAYVMRENPDLSFDQAKRFVLDNIEVELWRNTAMRPLQQISGSMGATNAPDGKQPNGQPTQAIGRFAPNKEPSDAA